MFDDRTVAGRRLADLASERELDIDVVLAVPRGGLPVGRAVADAFDAPLDSIVAKKLGAPTNEELAVGAATGDGSAWYNDELIDELDIEESYLEAEREAAVEVAREKEQRYRREPGGPALEEKRVAVVDDGVATGATIRACLDAVQAHHPAHTTLLVPVGPAEELRALEQVTDVLALERSERFRAVGQFYRSFDQLSDDEAMASLE